MAKAMVKCLVCGQMFDRNSEPWIKQNRRYMHERCAGADDTQRKDKEELYTYIKHLFDVSEVPRKIILQINKMMRENENYTYSGIFKSLYYFYEVKGNNLEKANGGINIVPYIYEEARDYYYRIWDANQRNKAKILDQYRPQEIIIKIPPPEKRKYEKKKFSFLDEEE